jgi:membrane dipeptidase
MTERKVDEANMNPKRSFKESLSIGLIWLVGIVGFVTILGTTFGTGFVDRQFNSISYHGIQSISANTKALHNSLTIADLHADSLLWGRDLLKTGGYGHLDIPRLIQGNVALQVFTIPTQVPSSLRMEGNSDRSDDITKLAIFQRWPFSTWFSLTNRALYQAERLKTFAANSKGKFTIMTSRQELDRYLTTRQNSSQITAGLLGMEGAQALEGEFEHVDRFYEAGFRLIGLAHFFDNSVSGSAHGIQKGGLTPLGRRVVQQMEKRNMIIDLAHASAQTIDDVLAITTKPVLVSHTGVQGTCKNVRNLSDRQIKKIAEHGGVIGIGFWETATCGTDATAIVRAIRYVADLVGVEHVALGSDFDGFVRVPFDVANLDQVTHALLTEGFSKEDIENIMGLNIFNLLQVLLPVE